MVTDQPYTNNADVLSSFTQEWRRDGSSEPEQHRRQDRRIPCSSRSGAVISLRASARSIAKNVIATTVRRTAGVNPVDSGLNPNDNDFIPASPKPDAHGTRRDIDAASMPRPIVPLVSRAQRRTRSSTSLELSASVRHERYSDFGSTTKPKFGLRTSDPSRR